jgi:hypothetical protein
MQTNLIWLVIGLVIFPLTVFFYLLKGSAKSKMKVSEFFTFIVKAETLAGNYNMEMLDMYKTIVFIPNIVGTFADIVAKFYLTLSLSQDVVLELLFFHLVFLVLSSVGVGLLRIAESRVLLVFLGELVSSWAFVSGTLFFVSLLFNLTGSIGLLLVASMSFPVILFLLLTIYFVLAKSGKTYQYGAMRWKETVMKVQGNESKR